MRAISCKERVQEFNACGLARHSFWLQAVLACTLSPRGTIQVRAPPQEGILHPLRGASVARFHARNSSVHVINAGFSAAGHTESLLVSGRQLAGRAAHLLHFAMAGQSGHKRAAHLLQFAVAL